MSKRLNATLLVGTRGNYVNLYLQDDGRYEIEYLVLMLDKRRHKSIRNVLDVSAIDVDKRIGDVSNGRRTNQDIRTIFP